MNDAFLQGRKWLTDKPWHYLLGLAFFVLFCAFVLSLGAAAGSWRGELLRIAKFLALALLGAKLLAGGYGGLRRLRSASARGEGWLDQAAALLPPWLLAWTRTDRGNAVAFLGWVLRRPHPPRPTGRDIPYLEKSSYFTFFLCGLISILVELPLDGMIASVMTDSPQARALIRWGLACAAIYTLVWMLGDRRQIKGGYQVIGETHLELQVGGRLSAGIPLGAITGCEVLKETVGQWCSRRGVPEEDTLLATPADAPNVIVAIDPAARVRLASWRVERDAPRFLLLFADDPGGMVHHLSARLAPAVSWTVAAAAVEE